MAIYCQIVNNLRLTTSFLKSLHVCQRLRTSRLPKKADNASARPNYQLAME